VKWSLKVGEFAGISVFIHATFFLLLAWVGFMHWLVGRSLAMALAGIWFILALFVCVLLHEFGHALTAKKYGIRTRDITLLPIGGLARLERMPDDPKQELWVALAGPAVNVGIAAAIFLWLHLTGAPAPLESLSVTTGPFLERMLVVNVILVVFNMLPAFPMDGGRVLRALLAMRMDYMRATQIASNLGQGMALLFGLVGLFTNPFLVFIALFVWIGAAQEAAMTQMKSALGGIPVSRAMLTDFRTLSAGEPLSHAIDLLITGWQLDFPVVEGDHLVGVLTRADLLKALSQKGPQAPVGDVMQREFQVADASEMLEMVFLRLQSCDCHTIPVVYRGKLVGLVTMDNVGEFVSVQGALRGVR
jgi:Zn-dependent protease/CBS domain-containing protein